ncbi:MAG TPA: YncE family protein [Gemmatimonadaceae bacterium]|nr:YncE family protein [Gemmatimonadaceae bacterium]
MIRNVAWAVLIAVLAVGCGNSTMPLPSSRTHPQGVLGGRSGTIGGRPFGIAVSRAGVVYVTQQDSNRVTRLDLPSTTPGVAISVGSDPGDVQFNTAGTAAYVSDFNGGGLHAIDVASNSQRAAATIAANAYRLALSWDEQRLFVSSTDGNVYVVDPATLTVTTTIHLGGPVQGLALTAAGQTLYASSTDGTIFKIDAGTGVIQTSASHGGKPQDIALSRDDSRLYVANQAGWVDVLDASSLNRLQRLPVAGAFGLALTPDDAQLFVTSPESGALSILDALTGSMVASLHVGGVPRRVAFDATGKTAVVTNEGNWVDVVR